MKEQLIYLDTYVLQRDMRVRLPKSILSNLNIQKGITQFDIFLNADNDTIILKKHNEGGQTANGQD